MEPVVTGVLFGERLLGGTIRGQEWNDVNGDGARNPNDVGLNGITVELISAVTQQVVATTVTADQDLNHDGQIDPFSEAGRYEFSDIEPG